MKRILFFVLLLISGYAKSQSCETFDTVRTNASSLITYNSARINGSISHIAPGQIVTIILKYVRTGQTDTASSSGTSTIRNLTGLQASTEYNYYYSTVCPSSTVSQTAGSYTFTTLANTVNYTPMAAMGYQFKYLKADSGLMAPRRDTTIGRAPDYGGQIVWKPDDSTFYGYNGEYWHALAIDSAGIITLLNDKVDSVTVAGDSLWYWKQGVSYGYILPTQSNEWDLTGNSGTTAGTNFVGTTDNVDLVFKRNSVESGRFSASGNLNLGLTGTTSGGLGLSGSTSGLISILPQAAAGTYNFNLPTTAGTSGYLLTSAGGGGSPMTWTDPASYATNIYNSDGTLTGNRVVELDGNSLEFSDMSGNNNTTFSSNDDTYINIKTPGGGLVSGINFYNGATANGGIYDNGGQISILTVSDKISMLPYTGLFYIDTLTNVPGTHALRYNPTTGLVSYADTTAGGGSGANTALSNLASVAINTSLISDANNTDDLGTSSLMWRTAYMGTSAFVPLINGSDAANGDLTIEGTSSATKTTSYVNMQTTGGYVGIGNTAPVSVLHVTGATPNSGGGITLENSGTSAKATLQAAVAGGELLTFFGSNIYLSSGLVNTRFNTGQIGWQFLLDNRSSQDAFVLNHISAAGAAVRPYLMTANGSFGYGNLTASPALTGSYFTGDGVNGRIGIGQVTPTAAVHIKAGTATASTAPIKLTTGTSLTTAEAGAMEYTTPQLFFTNGRAVRQELFQGQQSRVSVQYDNATTTLGNVTGLTANVAASGTYRFTAKLFTTSDVAGGIKVAIGGTATATSIIYEGLTTDAGLTTQGRGTALGTAVAGVTAVTAAFVTIEGIIVVNASGTLTVQAAANAATGTTSVLVGSTFQLTEIL